jgi:GNAT superfamily N-acetyltransferase
VHGIVVRPGQQRGGLGARLTEAAIEWLRKRAVGAVQLLATTAGRPVYERLGFAAGERYGSFAWPAVARNADVVTRPLQTVDLPAACALDRAATGEDRRGFIEAIASGWVATRDSEIVGFHLACPWGGGPTIAGDPAAGLALLRLAATLQKSPRNLGLPEANQAAVEYLDELGIRPDRYATRMWLGTPPRWRADMIFGVFNFGVA